jgi:hypothetical protein
MSTNSPFRQRIMICKVNRVAFQRQIGAKQIQTSAELDLSTLTFHAAIGIGIEHNPGEMV